jgi:environmental stress-induced protein Ves
VRLLFVRVSLSGRYLLAGLLFAAGIAAGSLPAASTASLQACGGTCCLAVREPCNERAVITLLEPAQYRRTPWKNGGGVTVDIAVATDKDVDIWRLGRTPIVAAGPFSDYSGFDRVQVLVAGSGLVLKTPEGEIDVRQPFRPVRFAGETPIVSELEAGPVEVVNLIGNRARVRIDIGVLDEGRSFRLRPGMHIVYNPLGESALDVDGTRHVLTGDHGLRLGPGDATVLVGRGGCLLVASIT